MNRARLADAGLIAVAAVESALNWPVEPLEIAVAVVAVVALAFRRRWPIAAFLVTLPALAFVGGALATVFALYSVALRHSDRYLLTGCGVLAAAGYLVPGGEYEFSRIDFVLTLIYAVMTSAAPIFFGRLVRALDDVRRAHEHERELDAQAVLAKERNQLAREMHDVVSHQVSLIAVQAGALSVSTTDPNAKVAAENVRKLSVDTLDELRHMVNLLRASGSAVTELTPQPTLSDLDRLVTGSGIETTLTGAAPDNVDSAFQRTIYRTIQEALTNVRKHAPGSTAAVEIAHDDTDLTVTVTNTAPTRPTLALPSARHGLVGLQERAALLGGTITATPVAGGGFRLQLRLPLARSN
ncbi:two-component sensor histidine kinase [Lentzea sp. NEAU-D13]|uniref:histidine kinase n=1 Tax=Lentzea alba TaxID=2714351 RepID=A0A7C9VNL7_9PSEU|nr:histidine kinase [Lentzea alba]NGY59993.1 two-component sensor histidine kinase [Lentzea alba]